MRGWLREYAETFGRYDGTSGSSSHQTQSTGPVPTDVDQTRAVSVSSGKDGTGKSKGKGKSKDGKDKGQKGDKSKDQKPTSKPEQFQGYCWYCEKWGHMRADGRKCVADGKSKGGAAAASADNDGDVVAVMEVDDVVMRTGDDETSTGWCFVVASICAVQDSGSDEHLSPDRSPHKLKDVQQNDLAISGHKTVPMLVDRQVASMPWRHRPHSELLRCVTISCRWENWCERVSASLWSSKRFRKRLNGAMTIGSNPKYLGAVLELLGLEGEPRPHCTDSVLEVCATTRKTEQTHSMRCQFWGRCWGSRPKDR